MRLALAVVALLPALSSAHGPHDRLARQAPPPAPSPSSPPASPPAATVTPSSAAAPPPGQTPTPAVISAPTFITVSLSSTNPTAVPIASIVSNEPSGPTQPVPGTVTQGQTPSGIPNAPPLPVVNIIPSNYPTLDKTPPTDSPQVLQWIQEVQNSGITIPNYAPNVAGGCPANLAAAQNPDQCWWSCSGCTRNTDITECPDEKTWGLTYDDGPGFYTTELLDYLNQQNLKSTFFVVGSRVISWPNTVQYEYVNGHQLGVHTWSHPPLTTLTNDEIIAELGWTKQAIKDITGVTPNTMRPPYGDIDDRVRAISLAMGLTPVIWTRISATQTFDTGDFNIPGGTINASQVLQNWEGIMTNVSSRPDGFIVLEHDLFEQTVQIATGYILPDAISRKLNIMPVVQCQHKTLADAYIETNDNKTNPPPSGTGANGIHDPSPTSNTNAGGTGSGSGSGSANNAQSSSHPSGALETYRFGISSAAVALASLAAVFAGMSTIF